MQQLEDKKMTSTGGWHLLHADLLQNCLQHLNKADTGAARLVCKNWKEHISFETQDMVVRREKPPPSLPCVVSSFPNLRALHINSAELHATPSASLRAIGSLSLLTSLTVQRWGCFEEAVTLHDVRQLSQLQELHLLDCCCKLNEAEQDAGAISARFPMLTRLSFTRGIEEGNAVGSDSDDEDYDGNPSFPGTAIWDLRPPAWLFQASALRHLQIKLTDAEIPESWGTLPNLTTLDLGASSLRALPPDLDARFPALRALKLGATSLTEFEFAPLARLPELEYLHLSSLPLEELPEGLGGLSRLKRLAIVGMSELATLPDSLGELAELTRLELLGCELEAMPAALSRLSALREFEMRNYGELSEEAAGLLAPLRQLERLALHRRECGDVWGMTGLRELALTYADLSAAPDNAFAGKPQLAALALRQFSSGPALPPSLGQLSALTSLELAGGQNLQALPDSLGELSALEVLAVSSCPLLAALPDAFGQLRKLRSMTVDGCEALSALPESLSEATGLTQLVIRHCPGLALIPDALCLLPKLAELTLAGLTLTALPDSFGYCLGLTQLKIAECPNLVYLPDTLAELPALASLEVASCDQLLTLPDSLPWLASLRALRVHACRELVMLPEALGALSELRVLELVGCRQLAALPESFTQLAKLEALHVANCPKLNHIPATVANMTAEIKVHLEGFGGGVLPENCASFPLARAAQIQRCENLMYLPHDIGATLQAVRILEISGCPELVTLPESIGRLSRLHTLAISWCKQLCMLPESLGQLSALRQLSISYCKELVMLPDSLADLPALESLALDNFELQLLPERLGALSALRRLALDMVPLVSLPQSLAELPALRSLEIRACAMLGALPEVAPGQLPALAHLSLDSCSGLRQLSESLSCVTALRVLRLARCGTLAVPDGVEQMAGLRVIRQ